MSQTCSPSTQRRYGLARVCRVWELARSTVYLDQARRTGPVGMPRKRGPKPWWSDGELLDEIRAVLEASPFFGEGHRKVWARLRWQGVRTSKARLLRLMREAKLLAPTRAGHSHGPKAHDGTITTEQPDVMWGVDATSCLTRHEGTATVFVVVDHCASECIGLHAAARDPALVAAEHRLCALPQVLDRLEARPGLGAGGALAAGHPGGVQPLRERDRARPRHSSRSWQPIRQRLLPGRVEVPGDHVQSRLRAGARGQWRGRTVHPHPQGTAALGSDLRHRGGAAPGAARVPGPVQPRVAVRTPPTSDARAGARPPQGASGVSQFRANPNEHEGRRGSRIDSEEGGRYLGIPPHHSQRTHLSVTINPVSSESGAVQAVLDSSVEHSLQKL